MAEIGFVKFAQIALQVGQAALPADRRPCSKRRLAQPQRLAIGCLLRDADWTSREAEVRLAESTDRRAALGLQRGPPIRPSTVFSADLLRRHVSRPCMPSSNGRHDRLRTRQS
jgi:hypothetical protein